MTAEIKIHPHWLKTENEEALMRRLHAVIAGSAHQDNGSFKRDTGYKWQLDSSNDWWAEVRDDNLILAWRYDGDKAKALVQFVKAWFR